MAINWCGSRMLVMLQRLRVTTKPAGMFETEPGGRVQSVAASVMYGSVRGVLPKAKWRAGIKRMRDVAFTPRRVGNTTL